MKIALILVGLALSAGAATEGVKEMPQIAPKKTVVVKTKEEGEALQKARGFGELEPQVRMMNLMMVEGSGFEGMDMSKPPADKPAHDHSHGH